MTETGLTRHATLGLGEADLLEMYRFMKLSRLLDLRTSQLNRMGRAPFVISGSGHEAATVGVAWALDAQRDWVRPYYRDLGLCLVLGITPQDVMLSVLAKADDPASGGRQMPSHYGDRRRRIFTVGSPVGPQFPQSVGLALAERRLGSGGVAWAFGGEGATSTGDWHEAMNFASVHRLPWVCVIENNGYAISEGARKQMAVPNVADRAAGYAMPGVTVDGMDVLACFEAARTARERAAAGQGPTLVEAKVYRYAPHTSDDDDRTYRSATEVEEWRKRDPIDRFRGYMRENGIAAERIAALDASLQQDVDAAQEEAARHPDPRPEDLTRHVYAEPFEGDLRG